LFSESINININIRISYWISQRRSGSAMLA
jgi:hypothetical protein